VLTALPTELRTAAFFNCWTRKEAIIKSCRKGTLTALHDFTVSLVPGQPASILACETMSQPHNGRSRTCLRVRFCGQSGDRISTFIVRYWQWPENYARKPLLNASDCLSAFSAIFFLRLSGLMSSRFLNYRGIPLQSALTGIIQPRAFSLSRARLNTALHG